MYILVRLLKGFSRELTYKIPPKLKNQFLVGKVVKVPLKNKLLPALVIYQHKIKPQNIDFEIREAIDLEKMPMDPFYYDFIKKISEFYFVKPIHFHQRIRNFLLKNNKEEDREQIPWKNEFEKTKSIEINLTKEQQTVINYLEGFIRNSDYSPTLLHGVTGSGKTEIYKNLILQNFNEQKTTILLLPEVTLSLQFQNLLKKQLPSGIEIFGFHSASKEKEKKELWNSLILGKPILIIGVHLPILLPISNLGLIIVDEEHETGFQEKKHPKLNSKELAIWRANFYKIPILLGSATPSLNSLYNIEKNNWKFFQLKKRFGGNFPEIKFVYFNENPSTHKATPGSTKRRKNFWITTELEQQIKEKLEKKEQTIIYINRRGFSFFVQCKNCGFIFECPNCSVSLTLHNNEEQKKLCCHYCDHKKNLPAACPECKTSEKNFLKKGIGTQQTVKILQEMFPTAIIERADMDTTTKKRKWNETVQKFNDGEIDILVGTQVITKGYHFPNVTLVGILWADLNLHFPVFNATETCLQKLIQVAGRTGRGEKTGNVIVQAMQKHEIFNFLDETKYLEFCQYEKENRKIINYPPFGRLVQIELKNDNIEQLEADSNQLTNILKNKNQNLNLKILGPSKPIIYKIQKTECRQIFIKAKDFKSVHEILKNINLQKFKSSIFIVPTQ
ncbi:MAG: primosomal protein N' [bacterium]